MSFYHDGQPAMGPFRHIEAGFAMHPYAHHDHHASLPPAPSVHSAGYSYADGNAQQHMYHHQTYADVGPATSGAMDYGVWQAPPQAPRLTAAAARAGRQQMMGYAPGGYPQMHGATAWYAQALAVPQPYQQPRTHQQLEHQLLVQHHLAKAHERQHGASAYQQGFAPGHYPQSRPPHPQPQTYYAQNSYQTDGPSHDLHGRANGHDSYGHRQARYQDNWSTEAYHRQHRPTDHYDRDWNWKQASSAHRGSLPYVAPPSQAYSSHQPPMQAGYHRHSDDAALHDSEAWATHRNVRAASQGHEWAEPSHYPQHQRPDAGGSHAVYRDHSETSAQHSHYSRHLDHVRDHGDRFRDGQIVGPDQRRASHADAWRHMHDGSHRGHASEDPNRSEASQWQAHRESRHETRGVAVPDANAADGHNRQPAEAAAEQAPAPAPSSPASLEKSALPIAAIGAQLIWNACTALFDPDLLIEAHETTDEAMDEDCDDAMSPAAASMPSSSSTPSLNTPDISPWASTMLERGNAESTSSGDWNAFRSPFGPDRMPQMRPQAHSFTFGGDHASSHHDLHRMAVGAERARSALMRESSPGKCSLQGSSHSDIATGHSFGASTASSSEPGTPASLAHGSPAMSSTVSAHSVETTRSPLNGLGMTLDRSRSDSVLRSRRSPSKASPKLGSSKWSGRLRDNVLAVLRLVSPDWRWSNNDHQFVSLAETLVPAGLAASSKSSSSHSQGRSGRDSITSTITSYVNEPSPAFRRFVHQVLAQTLLSPTAFLLGILNALRLLTMAQLPDGSIDPVVLELFAQPTSAAPFKLFTLGMMIANKHLDDNTFLNKTWNEVTGIPLAELNQTEAWFLKKCNYEVTVPDETWIGFLNRLQSWEEKRSSRGMHRDHDSSKRLLLVLDEALSYFDAIPALKLDDDVVAVSEAAHPTKAASPVDMWTKSHHRTGSLALIDGEQHCRSAPAVATLLSHKHYDHNDDAYTTPQSPTQLSRASLAMENPSATLMRSSSEFVTAASPFKQISPLSESGKSQNGSMSGPLMPSALLNGSRALFQHGGMFGPLSTSGWAQH